MFQDSYFGPKVIRLVLFGLVLTLALVAVVPAYWLTDSGRQTANAEELSLSNLRQGRQLYVDNCASCHGTRGEGIVGPALNNKTLLSEASDGVLVAIISAGRPNTVMTPWSQEYGGSLTDESIRQIVSFIRAWEANAPEIDTTAYTPSAMRGATLFATVCFTCHGENGQGGMAPKLNDPARLAAFDDDWYRQTVANGRPAKGMPIWGTTLSANQIEDLVALVQAWRAGEQVEPEMTVAEMLNSALFTLDQDDAQDALFYLQRARPIAFGPALEQLDQTISLLQAGETAQAVEILNELSRQWPIGDAEAGTTVYADACKGCHGSEGQGGVGKRLQPSEFVQTSTNAEVLSLLFTGRPGTAMRSFTGQLTEAQLADVIAFLRGWQP
jgi:mono/diheme cytochrome c family protein